MTCWPVVERELRSSARQKYTFYLRLIGAASLLVVATLFAFDYGFGQLLGGKLFGALHLTMFVAIWVFVPFLTADSISRERREGTLGLLFLTPLSAGNIVLAKGLAHALRAVTLWLAALPILAVPFLMGGVGIREGVLSVCVNLGSIFLALAAGLMGSCLSRIWTRILVWVTCLAGFSCLGFVLLHFVLVLQRVGFFRRVWAGPFWELLAGSFLFATNAGGDWSSAGRLSPAQRLGWLEGAGLTTLGAAFCLWLAIWFAGRRVSRFWREEPASDRLRWWTARFCRPVFFQGLFRRWMRRKLRLNPIGWLEQRSWSGRLVSWIWLGLVMALSPPALLLQQPLGTSGQATNLMALAMALCLAVSAAASFRRERETGVLELLLVSPLGEGRIISGRLRGLWTQFLPGAALLLFVWLYVYALGVEFDLANDHSEFEIICFTASTFVTVPVIGLYWSLRVRSFPVAFVATVMGAILAPAVIAKLAGCLLWLYAGTSSEYEWDFFPSYGAFLCQVLLAAIAWTLLWLRLKRRRFAT